MKKKKRNYGYGWRLSSESLDKAFYMRYGFENLLMNKKEAEKDFKDSVDCGNVSKNAKPIFFRLVLEDCE